MMHVLINHCWCSDSNWGGHYNCRVIVSIRSRAEGKGYYDPPTDDWKNLIEEHKMPLPVEQFDRHTTYRLKPEVMAWLAENVKGKPHFQEKEGWAVGTDKYNSNDVLAFSVFFQSYRDARRFIQRWSSIGKPEHYLNYFKDLRRKYNPLTKTTQKAPR